MLRTTSYRELKVIDIARNLFGGAAADFTHDELARFAYRHAGAGDFPSGPTFDQVSEAMRNGTVTRIRDDAVQFDLGDVRVIINESMPTRSTAFIRGT